MRRLALALLLAPATLFLAAASPPVAAAFPGTTNELYATVNRLRAGEGGQGGQGNCGGAPAQAQPPLVRQPALERAARDLAHGGELKGSLRDSGYRATRSHAIRLRGEEIAAQAPAILAKKYCRELQEPGMTDIGIHLEASELWIVTAARLAVEMPVEAAGQRVLELVNQARATPRKCGDRAFKAAPPVRWNDTLALVARRHSEDMARHNYFAHAGRDGSTPPRRVERAGYRYRITGENLAAGSTTPEEAVAGWIKSPRHCANLMNPAFTEMGAAYAFDARSEMGVYWTQAFGTPR